jgi:hypothetical protein
MVDWGLVLKNMGKIESRVLFLLVKFISAIAKEMRGCWLGTKPRKG